MLPAPPWMMRRGGIFVLLARLYSMVLGSLSDWTIDCLNRSEGLL